MVAWPTHLKEALNMDYLTVLCTFVAQLWVLSCSCWDLPRNKKEVGSRNMNYGHLQTKNSDVSLSHLWQNAHSLNYVIPEKN